jgi:hypothetical protein
MIEEVEYQPVYIKWIDASSQGDQAWKWIEGTSMELVTIHSLGFIINEDDEKITLGMNISELGAFSGDITVPKSCVLLRQDLDLAEG